MGERTEDTPASGLREGGATRSLDIEGGLSAAGSRDGEHFGAYEIVRHLGAGGMGDVYLARRADGEFEQEVAIKVMKRGMDTDLILRRFHAERQILAGLHHPNVCRLFDGGSTGDGLPYFVMEHIDGEPILGYCQWHALPVPKRLEVFLSVCDAVRYAHQNLVVHCDIKPANVLVTADGTPKLVDFGIAKLLAESPSAAGTRTRLMTPAYASPEQVRGDAVTTATDVHALGILLYQLLVGHNPFVSAERDAAEVERAILEEEPAPPSQVATDPRLRRSLRGDLDTIVLRALSKDPARRYPSAGELAADLERHRSGHPVLARRDTFAYRAAKLIRRHRLAVAAAGAVFVALVAGIATTAWQAHVAERQRARAERRYEDVRRLANALVFDLHDAVAELPGSTAARKLLLERGTAFLDALAADDEGDVMLRRELTAAYGRLGDVQGNTSAGHLGDFAGARASYAKGMAILEPLLAQNPRSAGARLQHSRYLERLANLMVTADGDREGALAQYRRALAEAEAVRAEQPGNADAELQVATVRGGIGDVLSALGRTGEALAVYGVALAEHRAMAAAGSAAKQVPRNIPLLLDSIGECLLRIGDTAGALARFREALGLREASLAQAPADPRARRYASNSLSHIGNVLLKTGDFAGALHNYARSYEIDRAALASDPNNAEARRDVAVDLIKLGDAKASSAEVTKTLETARELWRQAAEHFRESLTMFRDMKANGQLEAKDEDLFAKLERNISLCEDNWRGVAQKK
jgi:non-specific serine/threonine protein kinase/serine/threonine-protein kinase